MGKYLSEDNHSTFSQIVQKDYIFVFVEIFRVLFVCRDLGTEFQPGISELLRV